jgi:hypothetical protein
MSAKRSKLDTRTILYILIIILVIVGGYYLITNMPEEVKTYSPDDVLRQQNQLIGKTIVVEGYYDPDIYSGSIVSTTVAPTSGLRADISGLDNESLPLNTNVKYEFKGVLERITEESEGPAPPNVVVILIVDEVNEV